MVEAMKIMRAPSKGPMYALLHSAPPALQQAASDPRLRRRLVDTQQVPDSLLWGHCFFLQVLLQKVLLCPPRVCFPILCKFWQLYGGVSSDLLQEGLCHTWVCCTQSPCPSGRTPPARTSTRASQTQFCLSLCGVSGSWCTQGLLEPSEHLWWGWSLILNAISPLLPSCWGFFFPLGCGVSSQSCSSTVQLHIYI